MSALANEGTPDHPAGSASHPSMGPGTEFPRINAQPHFPSRAAEHEAIDNLTWAPRREPTNGDPGLPLSAARRAEYHVAADERWDAVKEAGKKLITDHHAVRTDTEQRLIEKYTSGADALRKIIKGYQDGDFSPEQVEAVLADEESIRAPELRKIAHDFAGMEEGALPDGLDPEAYFAAVEDERYRTHPALKSRKRMTEVEW